MADTKIACPHCGGHILYPNDLAGRSVPCPHCHTAFILPPPKSMLPVVITVLLTAAVICLGTLLAFQLQQQKSRPAPRPGAPASAAPRTGPRPAVFTPQTADDQDIARLCKQYSDAQASRDTNAVFALCSQFVKTNLSPANLVLDGAVYDFASLESVRYRNGTWGKTAQATVKRKTQTAGGAAQESVRALEFVNEDGAWKLFPVLELARNAIAEFVAAGFSSQLTGDLQLLRAGDAFTAWDNNDTNAFVAAFKLAQHREGVFPWNFEFTMVSNRLDNLIWVVTCRIHNTAATAWTAPLLEFHLKQAGQTVLTADDILPNVAGGESVVRNVSFLFRSSPQESVQYSLDVSYPLGPQGRLPLVKDLPVEVRVPRLADLAKFELLGARFDQVTNENSQPQFSARLDFRVENTGADMIQNLAVQCVWSATNGDPLDQSTAYIVGDGETPLGPGKSRTGTIRCAKAGPAPGEPVKADVFLQSGAQRALVQKDLLVQ